MSVGFSNVINTNSSCNRTKETPLIFIFVPWCQLAEEEEKEKRKKGTLQVARESGSISEESGQDSGDALSAEPSTTTLAEAESGAPADRMLPMRLGPVRIKVGKTEDWIGIGFAAQMEFEYDQQFAGAGVQKDSSETPVHR